MKSALTEAFEYLDDLAAIESLGRLLLDSAGSRLRDDGNDLYAQLLAEKSESTRAALLAPWPEFSWPAKGYDDGK